MLPDWTGAHRSGSQDSSGRFFPRRAGPMDPGRTRGLIRRPSLDYSPGLSWQALDPGVPAAPCLLPGPARPPRRRPMDLSLPQRLQKSVSGSFHKTALLQKRVRELIRGAAPLIETRERNPIKIAFLEMERGLIELIPDEEPPGPVL